MATERASATTRADQCRYKQAQLPQPSTDTMAGFGVIAPIKMWWLPCVPEETTKG